MEISQAVTALAALAHSSRLEAFRLLAKAGTEGLTAGEIAARLDVQAPTLSFHLSHLVRAGLVDSERSGRTIRYALRVDGMRDLLSYVTEDCCQGRPELCAPRRAGKGAQSCG